MTKPRRIYERLLSGARPVLSFRDFERLLAAFGFSLDRTVGSHRHYVHPRVPRSFPIQAHGKDAKRYQVAQFLDLVEEYGLHIGE
ncbi:MAG TPA: type II toxin-antitoxin system HicA family toxin [Allosphingosinicella sp.]|nr:type II toxin-antitoxin system HicA family toxin [Allosphingosinicella sp.]